MKALSLTSFYRAFPDALVFRRGLLVSVWGRIGFLIMFAFVGWSLLTVADQSMFHWVFIAVMLWSFAGMGMEQEVRLTRDSVTVRKFFHLYPYQVRTYPLLPEKPRDVFVRVAPGQEMISYQVCLWLGLDSDSVTVLAEVSSSKQARALCDQVADFLGITARP